MDSETVVPQEGRGCKGFWEECWDSGLQGTYGGGGYGRGDGALSLRALRALAWLEDKEGTRWHFRENQQGIQVLGAVKGVCGVGELSAAGL